MSSNSQVVVRKLEVDDYGKGNAAHTTIGGHGLLVLMLLLRLWSGNRRLPGITRTANDRWRCRSDESTGVRCILCVYVLHRYSRGSTAASVGAAAYML